MYAVRNWKLDFDQQEKKEGEKEEKRAREMKLREQVHVQSCAPAPLSCPHIGLNTYSQNQVLHDSQKGRCYQL